MIEAIGLTKSFDNIRAIDHISATIRDNEVFGLIGTNGAGKSTFLKLIAGILSPDGGEILINGKPVFEDEELKKTFFYISDDPYYFSNSTPAVMMSFYEKIYPGFDPAVFKKLLTAFGLEENRKIATFSKGMKKQLFIILGLASNCKYLLCDETFDGLDPVMRQAVKSLFAEGIAERGLTPVIASHNLRELEDICDHVGLLHKGGILFSRDLDDMKLNLHKIQCVLAPGKTLNDLTGLKIVLSEQRGSIYTLTVQGSEQEILDQMRQYETIFFEMVPLTLEEIFISETEVNGYDIKKLVL
ncbi:MAG: ABC transporter ATP-binding protein [Lachnospiraceae bacterium]|nr:ABC transporter ATP-binding protein [Lachnospiraceae bacterium]